MCKRRLISLLGLVAVLVAALPLAAPVAAQDIGGWQPLVPEKWSDVAAAPGATQVFIIRLEDPSLAAYRGGIQDLLATSPEVTGARKLDADSPASQAYLEYLGQQRERFLRRASDQVGRELRAKYVYDVVLNGLALALTPEEAAAVAGLAGVKSVRPNFRRELQTDVGPQWIGAAAMWGPAAGTPGGCTPGGTCGEGILIGVIDTGVNTDHPSLADVGGDGYNHTNPFGSGNYKGWCNPADPNYDPALACNDKLVGAYSYANSGNEAEDDEGHGSHTATTAGGNVLKGILLDAPTIDLTFDISGVAPHANIISYDGCTLDGCNGDDLVAAINQAVADGVDVINYSIGSAAAISPWQTDDALAFLDARAAGVFVAASAGNNGPGQATVGSPSGSPWMTSVGASTHDRALLNSLADMTTNQGTAFPDVQGRSVTSGYGPAAIVYAGNYGNALCQAGIWPANQFTGQIVVCDRGVNARVEKSQNVKNAGGGGMVLANAASNGDELTADLHAVPAVHITYDDGVALKAWLANGNTGHVARITGTTKDIAEINGDVMAAFSSRGPAKSVNGDVIKPDITAPGVDILAAWATLAGLTAPEFNIISGTSMSSPHMAGVGALMKQARPAWTPAEIQSALMTTAWTKKVRKEDGVRPTDPFDRGAGRVDLNVAQDAGLVLNVTLAQYENADPALGGDPRTLNLASMADGDCYKSCSWTRTVRNPTGTGMTWNGTFVGQDGLAGTVAPNSFSLAGGGSQSFTVTIGDTAGLTPGQWYFGEVVWEEAGGKAPDAHFPVAVRVSAATDSRVLTKTATPAGVGPGGTVQFDITLQNTAKAARTFELTDPVPANSSYVNGSATGGLAYSGGSNSLSWSGSLNAAQFVVQERSLSGYQSLAAEGIPPWDLSGLNLDTGCFSIGGMDFYYLDDYYTDGLISVNGLFRAGVPALPFCPSNTPQNIPSPDTFDINDNVIVPFWADLDLTGGNLYGALILYDGKVHTVIEWEDVRIKQTNQRVSFQLWIEDGTDNIWFAYPSGFNAAVGTSTPTATIGAENLAGTEAVKYYYYGGSGSAEGQVPNGSVDVWVGLQPAVKEFSFQVNATGGAGSNILNEATATVSSTTYQAWANARICGPAAAPDAGIGIAALRYAALDWSGGASPFNTYQLWRGTTPYFSPGAGGTTKVYEGKAFSFIDQAGGPTVGDPAMNYFYQVRTLNCTGTSTTDSNRVGEFDFGVQAGN